MEFTSVGLKNTLGSIDLKFLPSQKANLKAWYRFNTGITVTGSGVSQWDDVSGNGNHLLQATDLDRPQKQADGSILFDGIRQFLKATFTLSQPENIYLLVNPISWTDGDRIFDGNANNTGGILQSGATPNILAWAGAAGATSSELTLGAYHVLANTFDVANNLNTLQIDKNTPSTDAAFGSNNMGGVALGTIGGAGGNFSNIQVKEMIVYDTVEHDAVDFLQLINYLSLVGGLSL
jgi:hypothetical protein